MILLSQDVRVGHCFDASKVIDDLVTMGHTSGHEPIVQEMYHMAQFELFEVFETECEGEAVILYSDHFPSIVVPVNFLMEVENEY